MLTSKDCNTKVIVKSYFCSLVKDKFVFVDNDGMMLSDMQFSMGLGSNLNWLIENNKLSKSLRVHSVNLGKALKYLFSWKALVM